MNGRNIFDPIGYKAVFRRERPTTNKEMKTKPYADPQANIFLFFVKYLTLHNPQALNLTE